MVGSVFAGIAWGFAGAHFAAKYVRAMSDMHSADIPEEFLLIASAFVFSQVAMTFLDFVELLNLTYADAMAIIAISALSYDLLPIIVKHYGVKALPGGSLGAPATGGSLGSPATGGSLGAPAPKLPTVPLAAVPTLGGSLGAPVALQAGQTRATRKK